MPDILLIQPPIRDFYLTAKRTIPYGLACIAATLIKSGFSVKILDALATSKSRICDLPREMGYLSENITGGRTGPHLRCFTITGTSATVLTTSAKWPKNPERFWSGSHLYLRPTCRRRSKQPRPSKPFTRIARLLSAATIPAPCRSR